MTRERELPTLLAQHESDLLTQWLREQAGAGGTTAGTASDDEARAQSREFLGLPREPAGAGGVDGVHGPAFAPVREFLAEVARRRVQQGATPSQVATFVFSLKQPPFAVLRERFAAAAGALASELWVATRLLDAFGLDTGAQRRLLSLINDVLTHAKLESGRVEYALRVVDLRAVIAEVAP